MLQRKFRSVISVWIWVLSLTVDWLKLESWIPHYITCSITTQLIYCTYSFNNVYATERYWPWIDEGKRKLKSTWKSMTEPLGRVIMTRYTAYFITDACCLQQPLNENEGNWLLYGPEHRISPKTGSNRCWWATPSPSWTLFRLVSRCRLTHVRNMSPRMSSWDISLMLLWSPSLLKTATT